MTLFTISQTTLKTGCMTYPNTEIDTEAYDSNITYNIGDTVTYLQNIYISLKDNQKGVEPTTLGDNWSFFDVMSIYRPLQIQPTRPCQLTQNFTYCVSFSDCTHVLVGGAFGDTLILRELNSSNSVTNTITKPIDVDIQTYLFELNTTNGEQKINLEVRGIGANYRGFSNIKGLVANLTNIDAFCEGCIDRKVFVKTPNQYVGGVRVFGTGKISVEQNMSVDFKGENKTTLEALFNNLLDTPIFLVSDITNDIDINQGIYGYYSYYRVNEDCGNGLINVSGTIKSFDIYRHTAVTKKEIVAPKIYTCDDNASNIATKSPSFYVDEFEYSGATPLVHHSTDWHLYDSSNNLIDSRNFEVGLFKTRNTWRTNASGTYTLKARFRANSGLTSMWSSRTVTVSNSYCAGLCKDPFGDGTQILDVHLSQGANDEIDIVSGATFKKQSVTVTNASDGCHTTHYSGSSAKTYVSDKAQLISRFDSSHNTKITLSMFGYTTDTNHYNAPLIVRWGSIIIALSPTQSVDGYSGGLVWLESNTTKGDGSTPLQLNHNFAYAFHHWVFTADLISRTVKFYEDGELIKSFYDIPNTGTSSNFSDIYDIGKLASGTNTGIRGGIREFSIYNRILTLDELRYIQRAIM